MPEFLTRYAVDEPINGVVECAQGQSNVDQILRVRLGVADGLQEPSELEWEPENDKSTEDHRCHAHCFHFFLERCNSLLLVRWRRSRFDFVSLVYGDLEDSSVHENHQKCHGHVVAVVYHAFHDHRVGRGARGEVNSVQIHSMHHSVEQTVRPADDDRQFDSSIRHQDCILERMNDGDVSIDRDDDQDGDGRHVGNDRKHESGSHDSDEPARVLGNDESDELIDADVEGASESYQDVCEDQPDHEDVRVAPQVRGFPDDVDHESIARGSDEEHRHRNGELDDHGCLGKQESHNSSSSSSARLRCVRNELPKRSVAISFTGVPTRHIVVAMLQPSHRNLQLDLPEFLIKGIS